MASTGQTSSQALQPTHLSVMKKDTARAPRRSVAGMDLSEYTRMRRMSQPTDGTGLLPTARPARIADRSELLVRFRRLPTISIGFRTRGRPMSIFPASRLRRLRRTDTLRSMVRETALTPGDFILPFFV